MAGEFVSGTDILSNSGNAALGYSSGVEYNANPMDTNPFGTVQSTLSSIQTQDAARRESMRLQGLQEQKELADFLIGTGKSAFNLSTPDGQGMGFNPLEEDRQALNDAADDLRRSVMANPTKWKFDPEIQKKIADFKQLTTHASIRSVDVANKLAKAAAANNPEERDRIMQSIEGTRKTGLSDFRSPEPYLPQETFSVEKFYSPDVITGKNKEAWQTYGSTATVDQNGNEVQVDTVGLTDNVLDFRPRMKRGSAEYDQAINLVRSFYASPMSRDPGAIDNMNKRIDAINAQRGYTPNSTHFIPHIGQPLPNGQIAYNDMPVEDLAYSLMAEKYGNLTQRQKVKRTASHIAKERQDMVNDRERLKNERDRIAIEKKKAEDGNLTADERKQLRLETAAQSDALKVIEMLSPTSTSPSATEILDKMPPETKVAWAEKMGIPVTDLENYNLKSLKVGDVAVKSLAAIQYKTPKGALGYGVQKPEYVYVAVPKSGGVRDAMVVVGYNDERQAKDEKGNPKTDTDDKPVMEKFVDNKVMSLYDAVGSYIQGSQRFTDSKARIDAANQYLNDYFSGGGTQAAPQAPQQQSPAAIPPAIMKMAPGGKGVTPVEDNGKIYYMVNGKFYDAQGRQIT